MMGGELEVPIVLTCENLQRAMMCYCSSDDTLKKSLLIFRKQAQYGNVFNKKEFNYIVCFVLFCF